MIDLKYRLFNPTGNITALVETEVSVNDQPKVAEWILAKEPTCEQVGFISAGTEGTDITLRMAGGEFCGNATMSTAVLFCDKTGLNNGDSRNVYVNVVGTEQPVLVQIKKEYGKYYGTVKMPRVLKIHDEMFQFEGHNYRYPVVSFGGISHIIADDSMPIYMAESAIKRWCTKLGTQGLGIMIVNSERNRLQPLVYVNCPETLFWESSCASGTTATGAYFAKAENKDVEYSFKEPGGVLTIRALQNGDLFLTGCVEV